MSGEAEKMNLGSPTFGFAAHLRAGQSKLPAATLASHAATATCAGYSLIHTVTEKRRQPGSY